MPLDAIALAAFTPSMRKLRNIGARRLQTVISGKLLNEFSTYRTKIEAGSDTEVSAAMVNEKLQVTEEPRSERIHSDARMADRVCFHASSPPGDK